MIYASCRKPFLGGSIVFDQRLHWSGDDIESVRGKRVIVPVHGVKNTVGQIQRAYSEIFNRSRAAYDVAVGFIYAGGATPLAWPIANAFATSMAANYLADVIEAIAMHSPASIDIDAHSLGCPIALRAIELAQEPVNGLWLMAPAMGRDLSRWRKVVQNVPTHVFFSRRDYVLSVLYQIYPLRWPPMAPALGAWGERTPGGNIATQTDCTADVGRNHTGYRHTSIVVQAQTNEAERRKNL